MSLMRFSLFLHQTSQGAVLPSPPNIMNEILAFIVGLIAPYLTSLLTRFGLQGVTALWVSYLVSVVLAIIVTLITGTLNLSDVTATVTIIIATSQTIFHALKPKNEPNI